MPSTYILQHNDLVRRAEQGTGSAEKPGQGSPDNDMVQRVQNHCISVMTVGIGGHGGPMGYKSSVRSAEISLIRPQSSFSIFNQEQPSQQSHSNFQSHSISSRIINQDKQQHFIPHNSSTNPNSSIMLESMAVVSLVLRASLGLDESMKQCLYRLLVSQPNTQDQVGPMSKRSIQHRDVGDIKCHISPAPKLLDNCNRELRALAANEILCEIQEMYKLLDDAFFEGRVGKVARVVRGRKMMFDSAEVGSLLGRDDNGLIICLPTRDGGRISQETITILLREMAFADFWIIRSCSCSDCQEDFSKKQLDICDFIEYLADLDTAVNFHLEGFDRQWTVRMGEIGILKQIIEVLQRNAKKVELSSAGESGEVESSDPADSTTVEFEGVESLDTEDSTTVEFGVMESSGPKDFATVEFEGMESSDPEDSTTVEFMEVESSDPEDSKIVESREAEDSDPKDSAAVEDTDAEDSDTEDSDTKGSDTEEAATEEATPVKATPVEATQEEDRAEECGSHESDLETGPEESDPAESAPESATELAPESAPEATPEKHRWWILNLW